MAPASGVSKPAIMRKSVVFPQPDGPRRVRNSPARTSKLTLSTAVKPPKRFVTPDISIIAGSLLMLEGR
ncbi:MAG: hypothetical protein BWX86_02605 [Verrucomicrobia bacterium ADurb.Bin122]|nr:MAG: hypothetical protein BWX86_02605 [Verrucomicrobia bacterium ADurb.Bin122]